MGGDRDSSCRDRGRKPRASMPQKVADKRQTLKSQYDNKNSECAFFEWTFLAILLQTDEFEKDEQRGASPSALQGAISTALKLMPWTLCHKDTCSSCLRRRPYLCIPVNFMCCCDGGFSRKSACSSLPTVPRTQQGPKLRSRRLPNSQQP